MTDTTVDVATLRAALIEALRLTRAVEREVFAAIDPVDREAPGPDGGWSAKDTLAHLSAWRRQETENLAARREGREEPAPPATEIDDVNAIFHEQRAGWSWDHVAEDAESTADGLTTELAAADDRTLADPKIVAAILGDGPEHDLGHLMGFASSDTSRDHVLGLADTMRKIIDRGGWPPRAAAHARYNLACFHALGGRLDTARSLLRQALAASDELRAYASSDDDLIAVRDEIPALAGG